MDIGPPKGNAETRKFLKWAHDRHAWFCDMDLNEDGDCIDLKTLNPCYPVSNEELGTISGLKKIESLLILNPTLITDEGLQHLENMSVLKKLHIIGASKVTDEAIVRLKQVNPELKIDLHYRNSSKQTP